jgi:GNAT superfamily N-acetyltransferase
MYIHDLAVLRSHRGRGLARLLLTEVFRVAEELGLKRFGLVAVQNSEAFWQRWGFERREPLMYAPGVSGTRMVREAPLLG